MALFDGIGAFLSHPFSPEKRQEALDKTREYRLAVKAANQSYKLERQDTRLTARTERITERKKPKIVRARERTERVESRQGGRTDRVAIKGAGGYYSPEAVSARWGGVNELAETAGQVGAGALGALLGLKGSSDGGASSGGGSSSGGMSTPLLIGGAVLGVVLIGAVAMSGGKKPSDAKPVPEMKV